MPVVHLGFPVKARKKPGPVGDDQRSQLAQAGIVFRQNVQLGGIFMTVF